MKTAIKASSLGLLHPSVSSNSLQIVDSYENDCCSYNTVVCMFDSEVSGASARDSMVVPPRSKIPVPIRAAKQISKQQSPAATAADLSIKSLPVANVDVKRIRNQQSSAVAKADSFNSTSPVANVDVKRISKQQSSAVAKADSFNRTSPVANVDVKRISKQQSLVVTEANSSNGTSPIATRAPRRRSGSAPPKYSYHHQEPLAPFPSEIYILVKQLNEAIRNLLSQLQPSNQSNKTRTDDVAEILLYYSHVRNALTTVDEVKSITNRLFPFCEKLASKSLCNGIYNILHLMIKTMMSASRLLSSYREYGSVIGSEVFVDQKAKAIADEKALKGDISDLWTAFKNLMKLPMFTLQPGQNQHVGGSVAGAAAAAGGSSCPSTFDVLRRQLTDELQDLFMDLQCKPTNLTVQTQSKASSSSRVSSPSDDKKTAALRIQRIETSFKTLTKIKSTIDQLLLVLSETSANPLKDSLDNLRSLTNACMSWSVVLRDVYEECIQTSQGMTEMTDSAKKAQTKSLNDLRVAYQEFLDLPVLSLEPPTPCVITTERSSSPTFTLEPFSSG